MESRNQELEDIIGKKETVLEKPNIVETIVENKELEVYVGEEYQSPPPAPRYRNNSIIHKYLGSDNIPNKYHVNIN